MNITKHDICNRMTKRFRHELIRKESFSKTCANDLKPIIDVFLEELISVMAEGSRVELRGFGEFKPIMRNRRLARNPRTGEKVEIPAHPDPYFRFSDMAHKQFNNKIKTGI